MDLADLEVHSISLAQQFPTKPASSQKSSHPFHHCICSSK